MEQRVLTRHRNYFQVGSDDWNDVTFTGQRIRWTQDPQTGSYMEVSQEKAIEELEEIPVERNAIKDFHCTPAMHTMYRNLLGQIKWLQSRTQFQPCIEVSKQKAVDEFDEIPVERNTKEDLHCTPAMHTTW